MALIISASISRHPGMTPIECRRSDTISYPSDCLITRLQLWDTLISHNRKVSLNLSFSQSSNQQRITGACSHVKNPGKTSNPRCSRCSFFGTQPKARFEFNLVFRHYYYNVVAKSQLGRPYTVQLILIHFFGTLIKGYVSLAIPELDYTS